MQLNYLSKILNSIHLPKTFFDDDDIGMNLAPIQMQSLDAFYSFSLSRMNIAD